MENNTVLFHIYSRLRPMYIYVPSFAVLHVIASCIYMYNSTSIGQYKYAVIILVIRLKIMAIIDGI